MCDKMCVVRTKNVNYEENLYEKGNHKKKDFVWCYLFVYVDDDRLWRKGRRKETGFCKGTSYEEGFAWVVRYGVLNVTEGTLEDGTNAKYYEAFVPTMGGYGFELLMVEDGRWYYLTEMEGGRYNTNVSGELDFPTFHPQES